MPGSQNVAITVFGYRIDISGRLFEWHAALGCLGIAIIMISPFESRIGPAFKILYEINLHEELIGLYFLLIGIARVFALLANGHIGPLGPQIRAIGAAVGALGWVQLGTGLLLEGLAFGFASVGVVLFFNLALFDLIAAYRAGLDFKKQCAKCPT